MNFLNSRLGIRDNKEIRYLMKDARRNVLFYMLLLIASACFSAFAYGAGMILMAGCLFCMIMETYAFNHWKTILEIRRNK